jgi:hypothetical protein
MIKIKIYLYFIHGFQEKKIIKHTKKNNNKTSWGVLFFFSWKT